MIEPLYDKKVICLNCEQVFKTKRVRPSEIKIVKQDEDFCNHYENHNPYFYEVCVCPNCGLAFTESFSEITQDKKNRLEQEYLKKVVNYQLCSQRTPAQAMRTIKLALVCASLLNESAITVAGLCMRIAWLHRIDNNPTEEEKYIKRSLEKYLEYFEKADLDNIPMGKHRLLYILGELNGRLENYEESRRWFNMLVYDKNIEPAMQKKARERWEDFKDNWKKL